MASQKETINQMEGWGNDIQKTEGEYFYSKGFMRSGDGLVSGVSFVKVFGTSNFASMGNVTRFTRGRGRALTGDSAGDYMFACDDSSYIYQSLSGVGTFEIIYQVKNSAFLGKGMMTDPKKRLLMVGEQYLSMHDSSVANYTTGTVAMTNGSAAVVGTGTTFAAGDVGKVFRITGENTFYLISAFTDATHITLATTYSGSTMSGLNYKIYRGWYDQWKDFGSVVSSTHMPMDIYEDTVLIGRANNIVSLNTLTDTVTTDASPAFTMPTGFDIYAIKTNTTGVMLAYNFQGRGVLVLWDNSSDRSIAPWLWLEDTIIGLAKYGAGWVVTTTKGVYYTNGYTIETLNDKFLLSTSIALGGGTCENFVVVGDDIFFGLNAGVINKRRVGVYKMNLKTKLVEFYGDGNGNMYTGSVRALIYSPEFNRLYSSAGADISRLTFDEVTTNVNSYITHKIGQGENMKVAEAIKLPISVAQMNYELDALTFSISAKINNLKRQLYRPSQVKTNIAAGSTFDVDETVYPLAEVGDEIEFYDGNNKGAIRHITGITGSGTSTATYTLSSALSNSIVAGDNFAVSSFRLIEKKTFTGVSSIPQDLYFNIRNRYKGKKFMVKFVIDGATIPLELRPFDFIYDDQGVI